MFDPSLSQTPHDVDLSLGLFGGTSEAEELRWFCGKVRHPAERAIRNRVGPRALTVSVSSRIKDQRHRARTILDDWSPCSLSAVAEQGGSSIRLGRGGSNPPCPRHLLFLNTDAPITAADKNIPLRRLAFKDRPRRRRLEALALFLDYHTALVEYPFYR
jgi:hypothetical protein